MKVTTHKHTTITASVLDIGDFELQFEPCGRPDPMIEVVGNKAIIAYLVHDEDCANPLKDSDGNGELITDSQGVITDGDVAHHLGLEDLDGRHYDMTKDYDLDGVYERAIEMITPQLVDDEDFLEFCIDTFENDKGHTDKAGYVLDCIQSIDWGKYGDAIPSWLEAKWLSCQDQAWDELQAHGKVGTYLAVPVCYHDTVHGSGTTRIYTASIDNCNAVWVPGKYEIENIIKACAWPDGVKIEWRGACGSESDPLHAVVLHNGKVVGDFPKWGEAQQFVEAAFGPTSYADLYRAAEKYAQTCLSEYEKWCNGDCYGCVVEVHEMQPDGETWERIEDDACWGFVGHEHAVESLASEFFNPTINELKEGS